MEKKVNTIMAETMAEARALLDRRFGALTLDQIAPDLPAPASIHIHA